MRGRGFGVVLAGMLACAAGPARAEPEPRWLLPDHPVRAIFTAPREAGSCLLVATPLDASVGEVSSAAVFDAEESALPCRVVHSDGADLWVLACSSTGSEKGPFALYYGAPPDAPVPPCDEGTADPKPIGVSIHNARGQGIPNTWDKMFYLFRRSGKPVDISRRAQFGTMSYARGDKRRGKGRDLGKWIRIAVFRTYLMCAEEGICRFAINSRNAAFLRVDGEPAAAWPGEHEPGEWRVGPPMVLQAGPRLIEVYNVFESDIVVELGWQRGAETEPVTLPAELLLTSAAAREPRVEALDRSLHPHFTYKPLRAYSFRGVRDAFVPVRFDNASRDWLSDKMSFAWLFDGRDRAAERSPRHVFVGAARHRARLMVRDELGFTAEAERVLDLRMAQPREYAVEARVVSLPAVCYASDTVAPQLRVEGSLPPNETVEAVWTVAYRDGSAYIQRREIDLDAKPAWLALASEQAGDMAGMQWELLHRGVALRSGAVEFLVPPFGTRPARVEEDRLHAGDGTQLVLVPLQGAGRRPQPPITREQAFGELACIDDHLGVAGLPDGAGMTRYAEILARIVDGPDRPIVHYTELPAWQLSPQGYGPLLKLVQAPAAVAGRTDAAIVSIGAREVLGGISTADFERRIAALSDLVSVSMGRPMIWLTPPPYPPQPERFRPYAACIRKVADARHIPVADLYTAFMSAGDRMFTLFRGGNMTLSERGQELVARLIARALLRDGKEGA